MKISLSTHPESVNQLLTRSLKLYWYSFSKVFFLSLILSILIFIPQIITFAVNRDIFLNLSPYSLQRGWLILINLVGLTLFTALLWRIRCVVTDAHEAITDDIKIALKKIPYILVATLLLTALLLVINLLSAATIYFIVAHFDPSHAITIDWKDELFAGTLISIQTILVGYLVVALYFYLPIIVIENQGILPSLKKSVRLVWKNWWRTLLIQSTPWLTYFVCLIILKYIVNMNIALYTVDAKYISNLPTICTQIVLFAFFLPWIASVLMIQLRDLELRRSLETEARSKS